MLQLAANLTAEEEGYPQGPNHMFFKLMGSNSILAAYTHVFWMEWDVTPVRPLWIDRLVSLAAADDGCWMKGSPYVGRGMDEAATDPNNEPWLGHLNGNALYKLHDPDFQRFLQLVQEREPPGHYWCVG